MSVENVFAPARIGGVEVKNRIFRSATCEWAAKDNKPTQRAYDLYENLCKGEVGLIMLGYFGFSQTDYTPEAVVEMNKGTVPALSEITEMAHKYGTKVVAQLNHSSSQLVAHPEGLVYGPSEYVDPFSNITATAFSREQVHAFIREFGDAASLAKSAGFDGVQIHAAHGYLLSKFLSPAFNKRTDEYGGNFRRNMRIVVEILHEIKARCGRGFPVWIKLNSSDFHPENQGVTEDDFLAIGEELSKVGMDAIEVSGGTPSGIHSFSRSKEYSAYHFFSAKKLAEKVDSSVILVGGLRDIDTIDSILTETKIAAASMSRSLICEPDLVKRWINGDRTQGKCVSCNGCMSICRLGMWEETGRYGASLGSQSARLGCGSHQPRFCFMDYL